jgi:hypothetical protein
MEGLWSRTKDGRGQLHPCYVKWMDVGICAHNKGYVFFFDILSGQSDTSQLCSSPSNQPW